MKLPRYPGSSFVERGPRCAKCLRNVPRREYVPNDQCSEGCLFVDYGLMRTIGEKLPVWGHLHWECDCGYKWGTQTADESGHHPDRQ